MNYKEICNKYSISFEIAREVDFNRLEVRSRDFNIYDIDAPSKEKDAMLELMSQDSTWEKYYWQQSGPCSNWGYYLARPETNSEYEVRIKKEILEAPKKIQEKSASLTRAKAKFPFCFKSEN